MKFSALKKIVVEDLPGEVRPWITKVTIPINQLMEQVYSTLVNGVTLADNIKCQVTKLKLEAGVSSVTIQHKLNEYPNSVTIGQILVGTEYTLPDTTIQLYWRMESTGIKLTFVGLDVTKTYTVTIIGQV